MKELSCRHFSGYKPCDRSQSCSRLHCQAFDEIQENILVVHLGALGAVTRSTALLPALKRKHPRSRIVWVTESPAHHILKNIPMIDHVICLSDLQRHPLTSLKYSKAYCIDKSLTAVRATDEFEVDQILGFSADRISGAIIPANDSAKELWEIGLSNQIKFFENLKTENQLVFEALELGEYLREDYQIFLSQAELAEASMRRKFWLDESAEVIIGINVGCSNVIPYKKLSLQSQRKLVQAIGRRFGNKAQIVLLGGKEDLELAEEIAKNHEVVVSAMDQGLRDGMISLSACDLIVTGDSLGLHLGVGFKKWVVAWFGPTCSVEIDLYDRGVKVQSDVKCSPCWKRNCSQPVMCYDQVPLADLMKGIEQGVTWKSLSSKQPFQETCF